MLKTIMLALLLGAAATHAASNEARYADAKTKIKANTHTEARIDDGARAPDDEEQLAMAALEGLMAQPPERALPILKKVLAGSQTTRVKRRALFVLSQVNSPEARDILMQTAKSSNGDLRAEAIRSIGISGDPQALDALQDIYNSGNPQEKQQILQAWMIAGRKQKVYEAALNARSEDEAADAIRMLGVMGAKEELRKLGDRPGSQSGLLEAYAISGDLTGLLKIANGTGDQHLRVDAVRRIGIIHNDAARSALRDIYARNTDEGIRDAALQGMLIAQDDQGVLALYRAAKTTDEKRSLLRMLSLMNSDAALEAIDSALEQKPQEKQK